MEDQGITTLEPVPSARLRPIFLGFVTFFSGILVGLIVSVYLPLSFLSKVIRPQVFVPPTDEVEKNLLPSEGLSMGIQINRLKSKKWLLEFDLFPIESSKKVC